MPWLAHMAGQDPLHINGGLQLSEALYCIPYTAVKASGGGAARGGDSHGG